MHTNAKTGCCLPWQSLTIVSTALVIVFTASLANAQFYVGAHGGINSLSDSDVEQSGLSGEVTFDNGMAIGGAVGFNWSDNVRTELEITYRENDLDNITVSAFGLSASGALDGDVSSIAFMANGFYDFRIGGPDGKFVPYLGGGIGVVQIDVNDLAIAGSGAAGQDFDDTVFAFQLGGGVMFNIAKNVDLSVNYRYFRAADPEFSGSGVSGGDTTAEYRSHAVTAGIRLKF